jgi:hypothetical protein
VSRSRITCQKALGAANMIYMTMAIKQAKQTTVKQQENKASSETNVQRQKQKKP